MSDLEEALDQAWDLVHVILDMAAKRQRLLLRRRSSLFKLDGQTLSTMSAWVADVLLPEEEFNAEWESDEVVGPIE